MKNKNSGYTKIWYAIVGVGVGHALLALGGWTGSINGAGFGKAAVNVTSSTSTPGSIKSNYVATANMSSPSAAITNTPGYAYGGPLPDGASSNTIARIKGLPGLIWQAKTTASMVTRRITPSCLITWRRARRWRRLRWSFFHSSPTVLATVGCLTLSNGIGPVRILVWHNNSSGFSMMVFSRMILMGMSVRCPVLR